MAGLQYCSVLRTRACAYVADLLVARGPGATSPIWIVVGSTAESRLLATFFVFFVLAVARMAYAFFATARLLDGATPIELPVEITGSFSSDIDKDRLRFLICPQLSYPATVSWPQPLILLPPAFPQLTHAQQTAVLRHEFKHVRRRDFLGNLVIEIVTLPQCWNPAVSFLKKRVAASREFACDAAAASFMGPQRYAEDLVAAIQIFGTRSNGDWVTLAPSLVGQTELIVRIQYLTRRRRCSAAAAGLRLAASCAVAIASIVFVGLAPLLPCAPAAYHAAHYRDGVWRP
jgi:beta-lactamase regulating signal transducer with metallopeptidase domain